jgi:hypothetical protein
MSSERRVLSPAYVNGVDCDPNEPRLLQNRKCSLFKINYLLTPSLLRRSTNVTSEAICVASADALNATKR